MLLGSGLLPHLGIAGGGGLTGATWAIDGNGRAYNTPTSGAELLTNGGMEVGAPDNWTASASVLTSVADERTGGSGSAAINVQNSGTNFGQAQQSISTIPVDTWLLLEGWAKRVSVDAIIRVQKTTSPFGVNLSTSTVSSTSWTNVVATGRNVDASLTVRLVNASNTSNASARFDDVALKSITPNALHATTQGTSNQTPLAKVYAIATDTQAGAIGWLDNPANPQNFVIAIRNGSGNVNLTKCVAGVYTTLISISSTFVQDAAIEIRRPSGNTFQLFYNGSQVGTNQTINDTAIADNSAPYYGAFSTYSGNTFSEFRLGGNLIPFGF